MRVKSQIKLVGAEWSEPGYFEGGYDGTQANLSSDLQNMLSWESLDFVDIHHKSGMITRYWHWEYECEWCGSYDHKGEACPDLDNIDDDEDQTD